MMKVSYIILQILLLASLHSRKNVVKFHIVFAFQFGDKLGELSIFLGDQYLAFFRSFGSRIYFLIESGHQFHPFLHSQPLCYHIFQIWDSGKHCQWCIPNLPWHNSSLCNNLAAWRTCQIRGRTTKKDFLDTTRDKKRLATTKRSCWNHILNSGGQRRKQRRVIRCSSYSWRPGLV